MGFRVWGQRLKPNNPKSQKHPNSPKSLKNPKNPKKQNSETLSPMLSDPGVSQYVYTYIYIYVYMYTYIYVCMCTVQGLALW